MASNLFQSLFLGLAAPPGVQQGSSPKTSFLSGLVNNAGDYYNSIAARGGGAYQPNNAQGYGGQNIYTPAAPNQSTPGSIGQFDPNRVAVTGTAPYIPSKNGVGGQSIAPNFTSFQTGQPGTTTPGAFTPANASNYQQPKSNNTPRSTFITNASATNPTQTGASSDFSSGPSSPSGLGVGGGGDFGGSSSSSGAAFGGGYAGSSFGNPGNAGGGNSYRQQYLDLLSGIYSDDELKSARKKVDTFAKQTADSQLEQRAQDDYIRENKAGALARGVNAQIGENNRVSAKEQADLAIAASPFQSILQSGLANAKSAADFEQQNAQDTQSANAPFTLGQNETRYAYNAKTGTYEQVGGGGAPQGADTTSVNAWAKYISQNPAQIGSVPSEIRNQVISALQGQTQGQPNVAQQQQLTKAGVMLGTDGQPGLIDKVLGQINALNTGVLGGNTTAFNQSARDLKSAISTIQANLGFEQLQALRDASPTGGALGQVSERELEFLQSAVANLDIVQSQEQLRANLQTVKQHYQNVVNLIQQNTEGSGGGDFGGGGGGEDFSF